MFGLSAAIYGIIMAKTEAETESRMKERMTREMFREWKSERTQERRHRELCMAIRDAGERARSVF